MAPVKEKLKCSIYTPFALWPLSPPITKHLTLNHTISFQNLLIMIHSLNRSLVVRNPYVQNMPQSYLSIARTIQSSPSLVTRLYA